MNVAVPGKNEQSIEEILPSWKNVSVLVSLVLVQSCQLTGRSCSNADHIDRQPPNRDPCSQRVRTKSVSFATIVEKAGVFQEPMREEDFLRC